MRRNGAVLSCLTGLAVACGAARGQELCRLSGIWGPGGRGIEPPITDTLPLEFVDGLVLYPTWATLEPSEGQYDFSSIDALVDVAQPAGKRVGLAVMASVVPAYILSEPGVSMFLRREQGAVDCTTATPYPWDPYVQGRWEAFLQALAGHLIRDHSQSGEPLLALARHPALSHVLAELPGVGAIRDIGNCLTGSPDYDRAAFIAAALDSIEKVQDSFPTKFTYIFFFNVNDGGSPPLTGEILAAFETTFDGTSRPRLGLMEENLSCDGPPVGTGGNTNPLFLQQESTFTMFQMLQAWRIPHREPEQTDACLVTTVPGDRSTAVSGPEVGMAFAYDNFATRYFEIYQADLLHDGFADEFATWSALLRAEVPQGDSDGDGFPDPCDGCPWDPERIVSAGCLTIFVDGFEDGTTQAWVEGS